MAVILYPGAFKPPHRGHFDLVKSLINGTAQARTYDLESSEDAADQLLKGKAEKIEKIDRVMIYIGSSVRNGIDREDSKAVWDIYKKYLPGNVEVIVADANPMLVARSHAKNRPTEKFYAVTGVRSSEDYVDLRRVSAFKGLDNVQGLAVSGGENSNVRATGFRDAILNGSLDDVLDFFPKELSRQEILKIVEMLKQGIIAEMIAEKIEDIYSGWFDEDTITENSSGIPLQNTATVTSQDRDYLGDQLKAIQGIIDDRFEAELNGDRIVVKLKGESPYNTSDMPANYDYGEHFAGLLEYMIREGMQVEPLPEVKIRRDLAEAENFFGKTAYYNPADKEIVLYVAGRHPKDVTRSFSHEMVHHMQNLQGRLGNRGTTDTNADKELAALEEEAYLKGNMVFRNWEDSQKNKK
jgi:hypothetical protein